MRRAVLFLQAVKRLVPLLKRALVLAGAPFVTLIGVSYARTLLAPNSPGWDLRTAEWVRDNHLGWALDLAEWCWSSFRDPTPDELKAQRLSEFPKPFARTRPEFPRPPDPAPLAVRIEPRLPGEGEWQEIGSTVNGVPVLRCTFVRFEPRCPTISVVVARLTPSLSRFVLVPGTRDPGGDWSWHGQVPKGERENLLAAFNAGFRMRDARGGMYVEGQIVKELVGKAASLVIDRNGALDIVTWGHRALTPEVTAVRQNLRLLVEDGRRLTKSVRRCRGGTDRSGLGIAADGSIIYVTGHALTNELLAEALQSVGAVRGMELDAHLQWQTFNVYQPATGHGSAVVATKLAQDMHLPATRYLRPDDRDFIAAFIR